MPLVLDKLYQRVATSLRMMLQPPAKTFTSTPPTHRENLKACKQNSLGEVEPNGPDRHLTNTSRFRNGISRPTQHKLVEASHRRQPEPAIVHSTSGFTIIFDAGGVWQRLSDDCCKIETKRKRTIGLDLQYAALAEREAE
jgi:hypothetical protein